MNPEPSLDDVREGLTLRTALLGDLVECDDQEQIAEVLDECAVLAPHFNEPARLVYWDSSPPYAVEKDVDWTVLYTTADSDGLSIYKDGKQCYFLYAHRGAFELWDECKAEEGDSTND